jgi:plastocyanin
MRSSIHTAARIFGKALVPLAVTFLALAPVASKPALADRPATITGKVTARPARYLAETVVYLKNPTAHAHATAVIDQKAMQFIPHVVAVTVGDTVTFGNHDTVAHNVYSPDHEGFNLGTFPPNQTRSYTFRTAGAGYSLLCSLHPEMLAYVFASPSPYHAIVDANGNFTIRNVPAGTYSIGVWNPKLKATDQNVTVAAGASATVNFSISR